MPDGLVERIVWYSAVYFACSSRKVTNYTNYSLTGLEYDFVPSRWSKDISIDRNIRRQVSLNRTDLVSWSRSGAFAVLTGEVT